MEPEGAQVPGDVDVAAVLCPYPSTQAYVEELKLEHQKATVAVREQMSADTQRHAELQACTVKKDCLHSSHPDSRG